MTQNVLLILVVWKNGGSFFQFFFLKKSTDFKKQQFQIIFRAYIIRVIKFILLLWFSIIHKTVYLELSEGADYESSIRFSNFKMADLIWRIKFWKNSNFFGEK